MIEAESKEAWSMNRIVMTSKVGHDGTLHLSLPLGAAEADREVQITVIPCTTTIVGF